MEPGVPFALLGAVEILVVVASGCLAASGAFRRTAAGALVVVAGLVLGAVELRTALRLGTVSSDDIALARAAAALALAGGLYGGGLGRRRLQGSPPLVGVVAPLAAAWGPSAFSAAAFALAAAAAVAARRDRVGATLGLGLGLWGVAAVVGPYADQGYGAPLAVLLLRGTGALVVLLALLLIAQASLLSKVVSAILTGVVVMAMAAVAVVGSVVVSSYDTQARDTVNEAAAGRLNAINDLKSQVQSEAGLAADLCGSTPAICNGATAPFLSRIVVDGQDDFVLRVRRGAKPQSFGGRPAVSASELVGLQGLPVVRQVLNGGGKDRQDRLVDVVRLTGVKQELAVVGVASVRTGISGDAPPKEVWVYGMRLGDLYAANDLDVGGFGLHLLAGDPLQVAASNKSNNEQDRLIRIVRQAGIDKQVPPQGRTIGSQGANPTVALRPVTDNARSVVGVLAMTQDPGPALKTERDALRLLLLTSLLALVAVGLAAVALGRRTVDPVRRLTAAARKVAAGDLTASAGVTTLDEVGTLSRTFDDMTGSLARLTGDLRASAARLETVLASMTDGLLATDENGLVTSVNRAALEMLGIEAADVLGEPLEVVADIRGPNDDNPLRLAIVLDEPAEVHRPDGTTVPVRVVLTPLTGAQGRVLVLRDTTREREVERMKTEFLSNVSHELRTPLTPIRGYAEILVSKPELGPERVRTFATTIRDESLKMNRVVDLLVDVAAIEAGRVHASPRPVAVRELLDTRREVWQQRAPERAKDLKRRVASHLPKVAVDPVWLGKALDELLDNAVKYTPAGTPITLLGTLLPDGSHVRVSVRDAGPGIAEADRVRMFTSFEQVDGSATRKVGGLGLGLSFVRRLAEDAGFPLEVQTGPGGTEFSLDLPIA